MRLALIVIVALSLAVPALSADGNRLAYLDAPCDPYYVGLTAAKLTTPQWVGEEGVEFAIVLSIDDLHDPEVFERFLRPILDRLKTIDGRAPVSLMTTKVDRRHPLLVRWFQEGVNLGAHTLDHPCPCLQGDDFTKAKATYDGCIDALKTTLPAAGTVAFRMPCCDSMNSTSPRYFSEIFCRTTPGGHFLEVDSSVFVLPTAADPALPRELVVDADGRPRLGKYVPVNKKFVNYVEDYPYPYVIDRLCWELPIAVPGDWQGFNLQKACNPQTVADMKAAIDAVAIKQGVYTLCFHPHNWIRNDQVVELIDHAVGKYGRRVKFLNFGEVLQRITQNALGGQPLRAADGRDNGVRVLDVNCDGYMDVVIGNERLRQTRIWSPEKKQWIVSEFPVPIVAAIPPFVVPPSGGKERADNGNATIPPKGGTTNEQPPKGGTTNEQPPKGGTTNEAIGARFGVLQKSGEASVLINSESIHGLWHFQDGRWIADPNGIASLESDGPVRTSESGRDRGVRLVDLDRDGICELIVANEHQQAVFAWQGEKPAWQKLPFGPPSETSLVDAQGRDSGGRLVDIDGDGRLDFIFSGVQTYSLHLFTSVNDGWSRKVLAGRRGDAGELFPFVREDGTNNGAWFHRGHVWLQNETTGLRELPSRAASRSYAELLGNSQSTSHSD